MNSTKASAQTDFKEDVFNGLSSFPKYLYSKYIYDETGDKLFQDIMALPEYYLTEAEHEIFKSRKEAIAEAFTSTGSSFDLIELGAGDGKKTKVLLKQLLQMPLDFSYIPIDISANAVSKLKQSLSEELPLLEVKGEIGEYFDVLEQLQQLNHRKKIIMVLGSNMGNLLHPKAIEFLSKLKAAMNETDLLFMGLDQKKEPQLILDAYNDPTGVTAAFNKNLLARINKELGGNFDLEQFKHWEVYDPETGTAKSYLVSLVPQNVKVKALDLEVNFDAWETIHTEISQKYDDGIVAWLAEESGLEVITSFSDSRDYFKNYLFRKKLK